MRNSFLIAQISLTLFFISGCEVVQTVAVAIAPDREDAPDVPTVVHKDSDSIMVWYEKFMGEQKHNDARAIISEHCGGRSFEIELEELADSYTMTGTCT
jgi:hypothetical protein